MLLIKSLYNYKPTKKGKVDIFGGVFMLNFSQEACNLCSSWGAWCRGEGLLNFAQEGGFPEKGEGEDKRSEGRRAVWFDRLKGGWRERLLPHPP